MSNLISYSTILKDRENFRKSGTRHGEDFNYFDFPGGKYFKLFFYFANGDTEGNTGVDSSSGLLAPTWESITSDTLPDDLYKYNSAWAYLKLNGEDERAENLKQFVNLLSNISSKSPWYFTEVAGVDVAIERKAIMERDFKIDEQRKAIAIKCLPDAFDDRIGTLLDLYRSFTWSWSTKRSILPANLCKFDMGILIYENPIMPVHALKSLFDTDYANIGMGETSADSYKTSYKYIEFHNCEIDYNSSKGNLATLTNNDCLAPEYVITIHFDDCYESRYNEFILNSMGDFIALDTMNAIEMNNQANVPDSYNETDRVAKMAKLDSRMNHYDSTGLVNAANQLIGTAGNFITGKLKGAILGNLYTFSLTRLKDQASDLLAGDIWSTARAVSEYVADGKQRRNPPERPSGNLFDKSKTQEPTQLNGNLFNTPRTITPTVKKMGKLAQSSTLAGNL